MNAPAARSTSRVWHRALLGAGAALLPLAFAGGVGGVALLGVPVAGCLVASLVAAVALWSDTKTRRTFWDVFATVVSLLAATLVLEAVLSFSAFHWLYFPLVGGPLLLGVLLAPASRGRGLLQLLVLLAALVVAPFALVTHDPVVTKRAVANRALGHLRLLLRAGADPNGRTQGRPLLAFAVAEDDFPSVRLLLDRGADPNGRADAGQANGSPVLTDAVREAGLPVVRALLEAGAHTDVRNGSGETPLFHAARFDRRESVELLLEGGADVNARDLGGATALFSAHGRETAELLLRRGADLRATDARGRTALFQVVTYLDAQPAAALFLEHGLPVNARDHAGRTALFELIEQRGRSESYYAEGAPGYRLAEFLVASGADLRVRDESGRSPAESAAQRGLLALADLLRRPGQA